MCITRLNSCIIHNSTVMHKSKQLNSKSSIRRANNPATEVIKKNHFRRSLVYIYLK